MRSIPHEQRTIVSPRSDEDRGGSLFVVGEPNWLSKVAPKRSLNFTQELGDDEVITSVLSPVGDGRLLISGSRHRSESVRVMSDAWLAQVSREGNRIWQTSFDRGEQETVQSLMTTTDGGYVLAVNSSRYNKFGQGPSSLWLIRCDKQGNKLSEVIIPDARINPSSGKNLARCRNGFVVSYTKSQLPPISQVPLESPSFDSWLGCFDLKMQLVWKTQFKPTANFSTPLLVEGPDDSLLLVGGRAEGVSTTIMDTSGRAISEIMVPASGSLLEPVDRCGIGQDGHDPGRSHGF